MISKDTLWKGIIENLVDDFIIYFFPEYADEIDFEQAFEFLDTELQKIIPDNHGIDRHADKLIKAWFKEGEEVWFLVHVEVQGYPDPHFAQRMYEYAYRIRDKFQHSVAALAIYTDWDRRYHFKEFRETFMDTTLIYQFNTYVLRDHSPEVLAQDANPFAAVMEAAWQQLGNKKTDDQLYSTKLDLIKRLLKRKVSREKIISVVNFIKFFVPFTNSENLLKFEQDLNQLIKADQPMGIQEAILQEVEKKGIQQGLEQGLELGREEGLEEGVSIGEAKREEELLMQAIPQLLGDGDSPEKIALIFNVPLERIEGFIVKMAAG